MGEEYLGRPRKILVGIKFDGQHWRLAMEAAALARQWQAQLRLVHVLEPLRGEALTRLLDPLPYRFGAGSSLQDVRVATAEGHMRELAESIGSDLKLETNVVVGEVVASLVGDAAAHGSDLVIAGRPDDMSNFSVSNLPPTFGLVAKLSCAFLMLPEKCNMSFSKTHLKFLLCDDLTPASDGAISLAADLSESCDHSEVVHLHVNTLSEYEFMGELKGAIAHLDTQMLEQDLRGLYQKGIAAVQAKLASRVPQRALAARPAHSATWQVACRQDDDVATAIDELAHDCSADLVVFGRQNRHGNAHPLGIGRVVLAQMIQCNKAVLIARPHGYEAS